MLLVTMVSLVWVVATKTELAPWLVPQVQEHLSHQDAPPFTECKCRVGGADRGFPPSCGDPGPTSQGGEGVLHGSGLRAVQYCGELVLVDVLISLLVLAPFAGHRRAW